MERIIPLFPYIYDLFYDTGWSSALGAYLNLNQILLTIPTSKLEIVHIYDVLYSQKKENTILVFNSLQEPYHMFDLQPESWLDSYNQTVFFQLYRMKKTTFLKLVDIICINDRYKLVTKIYRGGNHPILPEKALLIFLWYMSKPDSLNSIADRFYVVPSTIMRVVNNLLYLIIGLKKQYIFFPSTIEEQEYINNQFVAYPDAIGAIDGTHVKIKVPIKQQDSYTDRYMSKSINLMGICTPKNIFTYIFVGFPGAAHDSRVFSSSGFVKNIENFGKHYYFLRDYHLIGDSAFPIKSWLMTPFKDIGNLTDAQKHHNNCLSSDRVGIEHTFGILKGRWRRLQWINTYSISKAVEVVTAACILHNFCYLSYDRWENEDIIEEMHHNMRYDDHNRDQERQLGQQKRDIITQRLYNIM